MALPQQVQDQLAAAEAMLNPEPTQAPEAKQETEPQHKANPGQEAAVVENVVPEPTRVEPTPTSDWEHKYKVLQGMFNKQASQAKELQRTAAELQAQLAQRASERQPYQQLQSPVVDASDADNFGQDVMDMVHRVAAQHVAQAVLAVERIAQNLSARVHNLEQGVEGVTAASAATAEQMFFERLVADVPNWEAINHDQGFIEWLNDVDPLLGDTRMSALTAARSALDSARVAYIFKTFLREVEQAGAKAASPLAKQLTPRAAASAAPVSNSKPTVSERDIVAFYTDVAKGLYHGREAEAARIENEFNLALAEGRVTV